MTNEFLDPLSNEFVKSTLALCGDRGKRWLDTLPERIADLERAWSIEVESHFRNLSFNYVAPAKCENGERAVLKIGLPLKDIEIFGEADFLRSRTGNGAVKLLGEDRELQAILVERAEPGIDLKKIFEGREDEAIVPAIELLPRILLRPTADNTNIILLDDWFDGMRRHPDSGFPSRYATKALEIYETLSKQRERIFYLHGDFHHENILSSGRDRYLVIDPKGIVGHIGYEIAVFLNNHHWWMDTEPDIQERLDRAVKRFSEAFSIKPFELRQWAFAQMVLSAWWTFDEMREIYNNEVAMAEIWDV